MLLIGATLLAIAAGLPSISWRVAQSVLVRVDLSPSTRTADFRDRDYLTHRIAKLLGDTPYRIEYFASGVVPPPPDAPTLADSFCEQTIYPSADSVVLLFSDCQFDLPISGPATYITLDSALDDPVDGAITDIDTAPSGGRIGTRIAGPTRTLSVLGATPTTQQAPPGEITHLVDIDRNSTSITARLNSAEAWPENDVLTSAIERPEATGKWWIGNTPAPAGWKQFSPGDLPLAPESYLQPSVIALANIPADKLDATRQQRLTQYVRTLGGSLLILGGDHAFGAGGYYGTPLDALSPLASNPPAPTTQWIILVDASGSMSGPAAGSTRWTLATQAAVTLLPRIPPTDLVNIGGFSDSIDWWTQGKSAKEIAAMALPPPQAAPHGPTNLQPAIQNVIDALPNNMPAHLLIISDFDATLTDTARLATALRAKQIHLDLLAIGEGSALPTLRQVSAQTGGNTLVSADPSQWSQSARDLLSAALPDRFETDRISVVFTSNALNVAPLSVPFWNRVWAKPNATLLAQTTLTSATLPMAAEWNLGQGRVLAAAFAPPASIIDAFSRHIATSPRDPRIAVSHEAGRNLTVTVSAVDGNQFLNDLHPALELRDAAEPDAAPQSHPIPQSAPGQYSLRIPAPRSTQFASVVVNSRSVDRFAVAGRYAPEFESIGNDRRAMDKLARRTGGAVILPTQTTPIDITWPTRRAPVTSPLAFAGAAVIGLALIWMRRTGTI